ncbi:N-acetylglutamate synthase-like GNAT family acetyltransferase [Tumebacillus sp. BK434]|uniref:GNAT family N-acetyltransferase n=1 Tax=Tumebacillus sp. BK434 TaxID=2512169 RepID=UPI00104A2E10|nr:hypothetical protein [Tumebacillus sp. BK434]TCP57716.1 N-acetylglutamate synthase-like GNAT family acetyltransferase [Tumebacillus sp. BK434]
MNIVIRKAEQSDRETIQGLLLGAGVSAQGVEEQVDGFLLVEAVDGGQRSAVGTVGLEIIDGQYGVMRSLVIKKGANTADLGAELIRLFVAYVETTEIRQLYLLTQSTAAPLFIHIGFSTIHREQLPEAVAQSPHFLAYKNQAAVCLVKTYTSTSYPHPHVDSVNK